MKNSLRGNQLARKLDRYLGIPLLGLLSLFRSKKTAPALITKIAILKTVAIGDTIVLGAIIRDLKAAMPNCRITLFTGNSNYRCAFLLDGVDEVIELPLANPLAAISIIRRQRFECFIDAGQWPRLDALLAFFSRAVFTIGFKTPHQYRHYGYDAACLHSNKIHEIDNFRALLQPLHIHGAKTPAIVNVEPLPGTYRFIEKQLILLHPWPGGLKGHLKEWPLERWKAVADQLVDLGYAVGITGGPDDAGRSQELLAICKTQLTNVLNLAGHLTLPQTATLLTKARLLITVNTGIMHLAAALDVPQIALHGPTAPLRWGPLSKQATVITPENKACGYLNLGFEYPENPADCMGAISIETVQETIREKLGLS